MLTICIYCLAEDYTPQSPTRDDNTSFPFIKKVHGFSDALRVFFLNDDPENSDFKPINSVKNSTIFLFTEYSLVKDLDTRAEIIADIYDTAIKEFDEKDLKDNFIVKFYLILPEGESFLINDFNKINEHLDYIISSSKEKILNELDKYSELRIEKSKSLKYPWRLTLDKLNEDKYNYITTDYLEYTLSSIINKNMDDNKDKYQEEMVQSLVKSRDEEYGDEIKNELDLVNKVMVENDINMANSEVLSCKYNGKDISIDDICLKLHSHTFPQYLTQINIQDTLDDEYEIVTSKGTIHRSKGGKISLSE